MSDISTTHEWWWANMLLIFTLIQCSVVGFRINSLNSPLFKRQTDTIYGLASSIPPGGCGIAIVRVSGPKVGLIFNRITGDSFNKVWKNFNNRQIQRNCYTKDCFRLRMNP